MVKRVWTLTERLGLGIGLALLTMGLILGVFGYFTLSSLFEIHLRERAESQARQLALFGADAILVYDYATLERYARALANEPGILNVIITRNDGEILAQAGTLKQTSNASVINVQQALKIGRSDIGIVKLSVDRQSMESSLQQLAITGMVVLLILIAVLFVYLRRFVDRRLILPVQRLAQAANPLNSYTCPEPEELPEELARLAATFRTLCSEIHDHLIERERAEQLARAATERLTREQRLATVGQVAAGLAHNLNTPLGSIRGFAQLLADRINDPQQQRQAILIVEQAEACAATVRNLLTAVRPPEVEKRNFDLMQAVLGAIELMRPLLRDHGTEVVEPAADEEKTSYRVLGDPGAVEQILFNLLGNASQAGATQVNMVLVNDNSKGLTLRIADNGSGIPPELHNKLFNPFVTNKLPGDGAGLGLYLSRQLAEDMGAKLELATESTRVGACFILHFESLPGTEAHTI